MAESIDKLRIYKSARVLEDQIYELVKQFPAEQFYSQGNDLRRSSAAVSHYIMEAHRFFSYRLKLDALANMRREAESAQQCLERAKELGATPAMILEYTNIIKQSWGLSKWLKAKLVERNEKAEVAAKEQMATA